MEEFEIFKAFERDMDNILNDKLHFRANIIYSTTLKHLDSLNTPVQ
jgi:hypothetical protein